MKDESLQSEQRPSNDDKAQPGIGIVPGTNTTTPIDPGVDTKEGGSATKTSGDLFSFLDDDDKKGAVAENQGGAVLKARGAMAAPLISAITDKPEWKSKIMQADIVGKWFDEYLLAFSKEPPTTTGAPSLVGAEEEEESKASRDKLRRIFETCILLLKKLSKDEDRDKNDELDYGGDVELSGGWALRIAQDSKLFRLMCECRCEMCSDGNFPKKREFDEEELEFDAKYKGPNEFNSYLEFLQSKCQCYASGGGWREQLRVKRQDYLNQHIAVVYELISEELRIQLMTAAAPFESDDRLDWHPGSNEQVLDLVHPSLYCAVSGVTKMILSPQGGETPEIQRKLSAEAIFSWIPTDFQVSGPTKDDSYTAKPLGYINGVHTSHLEETMCSILGYMLPDMEGVLVRHHELLGHPNPKQGLQLSGRTVQVICKMSNVVLTPEKPKYDGGVWHLEGMPHEKIVATGIYYYHCRNVTNAELQFRVAIGEGVPYPQDGKDWIKYHCGLLTGDFPHLDRTGKVMYHSRFYGGQLPLGSVTTKQGMCLFFPNCYQHRVGPIELLDRTKPGVRKILVFFLVDPRDPIGIPSTSDIASQRNGGAMSLLEAQAFRELLMYERKYAIKDEDAFFERKFSLCEH